jgi:hypothetical protein
MDFQPKTNVASNRILEHRILVLKNEHRAHGFSAGNDWIARDTFFKLKHERRCGLCTRSRDLQCWDRMYEGNGERKRHPRGKYSIARMLGFNRKQLQVNRGIQSHSSSASLCTSPNTAPYPYHGCIIFQTVLGDCQRVAHGRRRSSPCWFPSEHGAC